MRGLLGTILAIMMATICFAAQPDRIANVIDSRASAVVQGSVPAKAQAKYDQGPVDPAMSLSYITMLLQPSAAQQVELKRLLEEQQDPASPNYHKWLTPEAYGDRFGLGANDVEKITYWLRAEGFSVVQVARGRDWIAFSGTAALIENTFHTPIHYFNVGGEQYFSNATEISIPQALRGIVAGFLGLNDFSLKPMGIGKATRADFFPIVESFYNLGGSHFLAPDDIATIYDIGPLYSAKIDGTGMKMVVVGQVDVSGSLSDIDNFRSAFGLAKNDPQQTIAGGQNPGTNSGDMLESKLDLEWAGAVARNATILFITSATSVGGVFNAAEYAIDNKLAPVISMSYGACESDNASFLAANEVELQKANSEGITFIASSGDTGAAACDSADTSPVRVATLGLSVNYPASSPEVTGVGGTEFSGDVSNASQYWNTSNGSNGGSAISYIPETSWNDTAGRNELSASGGGKSSCQGPGCASGFPKPTWQTGTGVPNDGVRDVPDVAISASPDHDGYIICNAGSCTNGIGASPTIVGGTSASAPVLAGIVTLLNQGTGSTGLGNINSKLYTLAQTSGNGVFHDITTGNNIVPCTPGTPSSGPAALQCPSGGTFGYSAGTGYDQVTGLGSVDAGNLVCQWLGKTCGPVTLTVVPSQVPVPGTNTTVALTATVSAGLSANTPTGTITFFNGVNQIGSPVAMSSGAASLNYNVASLAAGVYPITATYSGDTNFASGTSAMVDLTIGTATTTTLSVAPASVAAGSSGPVALTATVTATSGSTTPTGTVTFSNASGQLGSPVTLNNGTASLSYNPSSLVGGTYSITASYSGGTNFVASTSAAQTLSVLDFSIAASPSTITISAPGQGGASTISITSLGGFNQTVTFSVTGLPSEANATFTSISETSELLDITTTAPSTAKDWRSHRTQMVYAFLFPGVFGFMIVGAGRRLKVGHGVRWLGIIAVVALSLVWLGGCGGGSGTSGNAGTPAGTSTLTITAASNGGNVISHKINVTLTVQ